MSHSREESINLWPTAVIGRRWVTLLEFLQLQPAEQILDVGCGRGEALRWIAAHVGASGRVVGVDVKQGLLDAVVATSEAAGERNIAVYLADAVSLPFPDQSFDAALSVNVLEAVSERSRALGEMKRVLRSGGRVLLAHADYESQVYACSDRALARRINLAFSEALMPGYQAGDGQLGRHLWGLVNAAGFRHVELRVLPLVETEFAAPHLGWTLTRLSPRWIVEQGLVQEDLDRWRRDLEERSARAEYVYCQNLYVCTASV